MHNRPILLQAHRLSVLCIELFCILVLPSFVWNSNYWRINVNVLDCSIKTSSAEFFYWFNLSVCFFVVFFYAFIIKLFFSLRNLGPKRVREIQKVENLMTTRISFLFVEPHRQVNSKDWAQILLAVIITMKKMSQEVRTICV